MENEIKNLQASNDRLLDVATNIKETKVVHEGTKSGKSSTFVDRGEKTDVELPEEFNSNLIDSVTSIAKSYLPESTEDDDIIANTQEIKDLSLLTQEFVEITKPYEFEVAFEKERSKKLENFKQKVYKEKLEKDEHITKFTQEYSEIVEPNPIEKEIMDTRAARLRRFKKDSTIGGRRKFVAVTSNKEKLNCMSKLKREDRKSPQKYSPPVVKKSKGAETTVLQQKDKKTSKDKEDEQPSFELHISQF